MTIIGIGCDIVQIPRISKLYSEYGDIFLKRIFSKEEIEYMIINKIVNLDGYISKRYAAKEAFSKATGKGIGATFVFNDIEVFNDNNGKPYFSQKTLKKLQILLENNKITAQLSLSDDFPTAIAYVVISF
jgi:holo-[acyl-carrier protein] synthase